AVVIATTAALLGMSLREAIAADPGFASSNVLSMRVSAYDTRYAQRADVVRFFERAVERAAALPAVRAAAASSALPFSGSNPGTAVGVESKLVPIGERPAAGWQTVTPGYFAALGIPLLAGRDFSRSDLARPTHQTILSRSLARRLFGTTDPIGQRITLGPDS